jgi:hypothetical protein
VIENLSLGTSGKSDCGSQIAQRIIPDANEFATPLSHTVKENRAPFRARQN